MGAARRRPIPVLSEGLGAHDSALRPRGSVSRFCRLDSHSGCTRLVPKEAISEETGAGEMTPDGMFMLLRRLHTTLDDQRGYGCPGCNEEWGFHPDELTKPCPWAELERMFAPPKPNYAAAAESWARAADADAFARVYPEVK